MRIPGCFISYGFACTRRHSNSKFTISHAVRSGSSGMRFSAPSRKVARSTTTCDIGMILGHTQLQFYPIPTSMSYRCTNRQLFFRVPLLFSTRHVRASLQSRCRSGLNAMTLNDSSHFLVRASEPDHPEQGCHREMLFWAPFVCGK
jgi:hypothetical protein